LRLIDSVSLSDTHTKKQTHTHTHTHTHTLYDSPHGQLVAEAAVYTTQQTKENNNHALSGVRTRDLSNLAAADLRLRPHGHRDQPHFNSVQGTIVPASSKVYLYV
jgi:hypothetical protein